MDRRIVVAAGVALVLSLTGCAAPGGPDTDPARVADARDTHELSGDQTGSPTADRSGALPDGGAAASCVEEYAPSAVSGRSFAFDGTVLEVGPSVSDRGDGADLDLPGVTFEVHEWFSGGSGDTVVVDMQIPAVGSAAPSEDGQGYTYGIGSRLLVSGEPRWGGVPLAAPIGWSCGFSRYHDASTAAAWRDAVRR
jgi:hypothetical protein